MPSLPPISSALSAPAVFLFGPRRAGKTSIARTVLAREPPHEAIFLAPTAARRPRAYHVRSALFPFCVWDWPGGHSWRRCVVS